MSVAVHVLVDNRGMTLTSIMVAVALSSIIAVFGTRMITDQLTLANTAVLIAKGDSVFRFFSGLVMDSDIWEKTLDNDSGLKNYVKGHTTSTSSKTRTKMVDINGKTLIPSTGATLKDAISSSVSGGWWKVDLFWEGKGKGTVDMILELCLSKTAFQNDPKNDGKKAIANSFAFLCEKNKKKTMRIRYSEQSLQARSCNGRAVVAIDRHSASTSRQVRCSSYRLVNTNQQCANGTFLNKIQSGSGECATGRTGVDPTTCRRGSFLQVLSNGTTRCSTAKLLVKRNEGRCPASGGSPEHDVVCGFESDMSVRCCKSKGEKGVQGQRLGAKGRTGPYGPYWKGRIGAVGEKGPDGHRGPPGEKGENASCS